MAAATKHNTSEITARRQTPISPTMATPVVDCWEQIASEHCYPKLMVHWSSVGQSLPTCHLFQSKDEKETDDCDPENDDDMVIDVVGGADTPLLPYNHQKAKSIMNECTQHMNLVRLPLENPELELERVFSECSYQQQTLLNKCLQVFREDLLARLACAQTQEEPILRRLHSDRAAKQIRKIFADIKWDPLLTQWCHRKLIRVLDSDLLPIYMDVLQVLKSNCPALIEHMIHSGPSGGEGVNEALKLLLKRPWNPSIGMVNLDKQLHFDPAPLFVTIPHTTSVLGSRRWRLWQSQFNTIGKVFPVVIQEHRRDAGQRTTLRESVETIIQCTLLRVQELKDQYPSRPIVLISWTTGCRVACKVAEVEKVACLVNFGLPVQGLKHTWKLADDPFVDCTTPSIFLIGDKDSSRTLQYAEELRQKIKAQTALVIVHGADEMLRLPTQDREKELITQSMIDRLIQDRIYEFFVYVLPSSLSIDAKPTRKRKFGSFDEPSNSFLSSATPNSPIVLNAHVPDDSTRLSSLTASNSVLRSLLGVRSGGIPQTGGGRSGNEPSTSVLPAKIPRIGRPPKLGRPRSKSVTYSGVTDAKQQKSKPSARVRSKSGDVSVAGSSSSPPRSPKVNGNNSNNASPDTLLSLTRRQLCPLQPITPPKTSSAVSTPPPPPPALLKDPSEQ